MLNEVKKHGGEKASRKCPNCHSRRIWKDGIRENKSSPGAQRYKCRECGYRFSESSVLSSHEGYIGSRQVCAFLTEAKNLSKVETRKNGLAGATADIKGKPVDFAFWLKKEGYADSTVRMRSRKLRHLIRLGANILNPESIKETIANQSWNPSTKMCYISTYNTFTEMLGISWKQPRYKQQRSYPFIPTEKELDTLIASCGKKTATFLQLLKETAMRAGEAKTLEWNNIDSERRLINLTRPEKGSNPRIFKVSVKLMRMLEKLPRITKMVFGTGNVNSARTTFFASRKRAARKLANPRLVQIHFHTFRHWKATYEMHRTGGSIYYVKQLLGHKSIKNTELYIHLEKAIFGEGKASEYATRVAKTVKGARALIAAGFDYVTDMHDFKLFRKRK